MSNSELNIQKTYNDIKEDSELVEKLESFSDDIYGTIPKVFEH